MLTQSLSSRNSGTRNGSPLSPFSKSLSHLNYSSIRKSRAIEEIISDSSSDDTGNDDHGENDSAIHHGMNCSLDAKVAYTMTTDNPFLSGPSTVDSNHRGIEVSSLNFSLRKDSDAVHEDPTKRTNNDYRSEYCDDDVSSVSMDSIRRQNPYWSLEMEQTLNPAPPVLISFRINDSALNKICTEINDNSEGRGNTMTSSNISHVPTIAKDTVLPDWELEWLRSQEPDQNRETTLSLNASCDNDENAFSFQNEGVRKGMPRTIRHKHSSTLESPHRQGIKVQLIMPPLLHSPWQSRRKHVNVKTDKTNQRLPALDGLNPIELSESNLELQYPLGIQWLGRSKSAPATKASKGVTKLTEIAQTPKFSISHDSDSATGILVPTASIDEIVSPQSIVEDNDPTRSGIPSRSLVQRRTSVPRHHRIKSAGSNFLVRPLCGLSSNAHSIIDNNQFHISPSDSPRSVADYAAHERLSTAKHLPTVIQAVKSSSVSRSDDGSLTQSKDEWEADADIVVCNSNKNGKKKLDPQSRTFRFWDRAKASLSSPRRSSAEKPIVEKKICRENLPVSCLI